MKLVVVVFIFFYHFSIGSFKPIEHALDKPAKLTILTDLHQQLKLGQFANDKPVEIFMDEDELAKTIKLGGEHTMHIVRPRKPYRFMLPDMSFRLFCQSFEQWTNVSNLEWAKSQKRATNLIVYGFSTALSKGPEIVCQLVDVMEQAEADCLLAMERRDGTFPVIEVLNNTQYTKLNHTSRDALPGGTYCSLYLSGSEFVTYNPTDSDVASNRAATQNSTVPMATSSLQIKNDNNTSETDNKNTSADGTTKSIAGGFFAVMVCILSFIVYMKLTERVVVDMPVPTEPDHKDEAGSEKFVGEEIDHKETDSGKAESEEAANEESAKETVESEQVDQQEKANQV